MSQNLMKTEPGGDTAGSTSQYTSIQSVNVPHKKSGGQMGQAESQSDINAETAAQENAEKGAASAEKIRYGQAMSENGMGGQTTGLGDANTGSGYGSIGDEAKDEEDAEAERKKSGYGGDNDMNTEIGA